MEQIKKILFLKIFILLLVVNYSCKKEFEPSIKSKVVVVKNSIYSDISYKDNSNSKTIEPELSVILRDVETDYSYSASTYGTSSTGTQLGEKITWSDNFTLETDTSSVKLEAATDYFFLFIKNNSTTTYGPISVNYGNYDQKTENIQIPASSSTTYRIAYYKTHSDTKIRFLYNNSLSYITKTAGTDFNFPNKTNQCVVITINNKKNIVVSNKVPNKSSLVSIKKDDL